jgi:preprotein translocase subunit SecD
MKHVPKAETVKEPPHAVRVFRAGVILIIGALVGYFVYATTANPESRYPFKFGLDLAGGSHLVYDANLTDVAVGEEEEAMSSLREVVERRINNGLGVAEPNVQTEKSSSVAGDPVHRLIVEIPSETDVNKAVESIGKTPLLEFKLVNREAIAALQALQNASTSGAGISNVSVNGEEVGEPYTETGLTGRYIKRAQLSFGNSSGVQAGISEPLVQVTFNDEGRQLFTDITTKHTNEQLAIFLDGELLSDPVIREPITGGSAVISGSFTPESAKELVRNLNFGALPVPITLAGTQTIGAALGEEALNAGVHAGIIGFVALSLFMMFWYRLPGVIAVVALLLYIIMMLALFKLIPVVLTAAGIAGFIISVGLAVDANILIAERIKEELHDGHELGVAIRTGFSRAWLAIRDSNIAHIIAGIILFWFGTSLIKGFALVFSLGVVVSMLSAITISRTLLVAMKLNIHTKVGRFLMGSGITE